MTSRTAETYTGDPTKPGAWTQADIDTWNQVAECASNGHEEFWQTHPRPAEDICPACGAIVRSVTDTAGWADHWAEQRADDNSWEGQR